MREKEKEKAQLHALEQKTYKTGVCSRWVSRGVWIKVLLAFLFVGLLVFFQKTQQVVFLC